MSFSKKLKSLVTRDFKKKEDGNSTLVSGVFTMVISITAMSLICLYVISSVGIMNTKSDINGVMRKYIIRMETYGYLTDDDETELLQELSDAGMTNIDISGTTMDEVEYGDTIYLYVKGSVATKRVTLSSFPDSIWQDKSISIDEKLSSTSQQ